ncbi:MerR family transcriptional regulator [Clostridium nigeriense]|uniref:MerR family transcriptional regulator n=1 Tax=Clostridium nigeriense TaxID=1805470 RepID=UPI003D350BB1
MYSMKEACQLTNMTYDTLKFYCNKGLVPNVKRDKNNYRIFDDNNIGWLKSLSCLKKCGMSIEEIKEYLDYCLQGQNTIPERKVILNKKRQKLIEQMKVIQESIDYIDSKQQLYDDVMNGKIEYQSNLIVK